MGTVTDFLEHLLLRRARAVPLRVRGAGLLTPHMMRVEFEGDDIAHLATDGNLHVRLLLPPEGARRDDWLSIDASGRVDGGASPVYRKYTIRRIDAAAGRLWIDFVLHGDAGPGSAWAARARPGDLVGAIGPGGRSVEPADWYLIAGDETALPAIGRIAGFLPADAKGIVLAEIAGPAEEQDLRLPAGMVLRWLHRGAAPGTVLLLPPAVAGVAIPDLGSIFIWVGAEYEAAAHIRGGLRKTRKVDKSNSLVVPYWRRDAGS